MTGQEDERYEDVRLAPDGRADDAEGGSAEEEEVKGQVDGDESTMHRGEAARRGWSGEGGAETEEEKKGRQPSRQLLRRTRRMSEEDRGLQGEAEVSTTGRPRKDRQRGWLSEEERWEGVARSRGESASTDLAARDRFKGEGGGRGARAGAREKGRPTRDASFLPFLFARSAVPPSDRPTDRPNPGLASNRTRARACPSRRRWVERSPGGGGGVCHDRS